MEDFIKISISLLSLLAIGFGHAQTAARDWKWEPSPQDDPVLFIGTDTISKNATALGPQGQWWQSFGYPDLDSLVQTALDNNRELKGAQARLEQARARKNLALAEMFPAIRVEPSATRQQLSANRANPFGGALSKVTVNNFDLPVTLSYQLDLFGTNLDKLLAERLNADASGEQFKNIQLQVATEVSQNYFLLLQLDSENRLLQDTKETRVNNLDITSTRYGAGLVSQIDVLRAKTELSAVEVQLKSNNQLRAQVELALALLVGKDASDFEVPFTPIQFLPPPMLIAEKEDLEAQRPDILAAKYTLEASKKSLRSQKKELLPAVYVNSAYGYNAGDADLWTDEDSKAWNVGVSASLPIFEGGKKRAQIKLRKSELQEAQEAYDQQLLTAYQEVESAYAQLNLTHEQLLAQQDLVKAAIEAATLTSERYRKGLVNYIDVVDAERQVLDAEQLSVQLFGQELIGRVTLVKAMGLYSGL